jgi:hypothetical protein
MAIDVKANVDRFTVRLTGFGANKILVIKHVREITGLGLKEAKELVEAASDSEPQMIFVQEPIAESRYMDQDTARGYLAKLLLAGASADIYQINEDGSETQVVADWVPIAVRVVEERIVHPDCAFVVEQMTQMPSMIAYIDRDGVTREPILTKENIDPKWEIVGIRHSAEEAEKLAHRQANGNVFWNNLMTIPPMRIRRFNVG